MNILSIIIPVYNEEKTIFNVLESTRDAFKDTEYEIIIVDDGSRDNTRTICETFITAYKNINYINLPQNHGKGFALRAGFLHTNGTFIAIQDADMEYNPNMLRELYKNVEENIVIYGKRDRKQGYFLNKIGNAFLSLLCNILYKSNLFDIYTCYKIIPNKILKSLELTSDGFEIEAEITAKLLRKKTTIKEIPITYSPRSFKEGKHIRAYDALKGIWTLIKNKFCCGDGEI